MSAEVGWYYLHFPLPRARKQCHCSGCELHTFSLIGDFLSPWPLTTSSVGLGPLSNTTRQLLFGDPRQHVSCVRTEFCVHSVSLNVQPSMACSPQLFPAPDMAQGTSGTEQMLMVPQAGPTMAFPYTSPLTLLGCWLHTHILCFKTFDVHWQTEATVWS